VSASDSAVAHRGKRYQVGIPGLIHRVLLGAIVRSGVPMRVLEPVCRFMVSAQGLGHGRWTEASGT